MRSLAKRVCQPTTEKESDKESVSEQPDWASSVVGQPRNEIAQMGSTIKHSPNEIKEEGVGHGSTPRATEP